MENGFSFWLSTDSEILCLLDQNYHVAAMEVLM